MDADKLQLAATAAIPRPSVSICGFLQAAVFVRRTGAHGAGHIGWGWECRPEGDLVAGTSELVACAGAWCVGSVDNPPNMPFTPVRWIGYWCVFVDDPVATMRAHDYDEYKLLSVPNARPAAALRVAQRVARLPYVVLGRNCLDSTYDVLRAFGAQLPSPFWHPVPNRWFDTVAGEPHRVRD